MKKSFFLLLFICFSSINTFSQEVIDSEETPPDSAAYGNLVIFSDPQDARVEIQALQVDYVKADKFVNIEFIPPAKYLVRLSKKKKVLEYEADVQPYIESHLFFDLNNKTVTLESEYKILPKNATPETEDHSEVFTLVEEQPLFPGGEEARIRFLQENIKYPELAKSNGIQGRVFVTFVVEKDGSLSQVRVLRGIGGGCDEEAIRVIQLMPKWNPGRQSGEPVRVQFNLPMKFTLVNMPK